MCGIAAVLLHPQSRRAEVWQAIRAAFTRNLISNEARGQSATGVAVVQSSGEAVVYKLPIRASRFVGTEAYRDILSMIGAHTTAVLGHTRMPTQGSSNNPANNHPIEVRPVLGVHNGHVANDAELFARWHLPRQAQVDSEVIFQMLAAVPPTSLNGQYLTTIGENLAQLEGQFTFIAVDQRCPSHLLVFKHVNPLCVHYHAEWQSLFFSSRYIFLRQAFGRSVITEALPHNQLLCFEAERLPDLHQQPCAATAVLQPLAA